MNIDRQLIADLNRQAREDRGVSRAASSSPQPQHFSRVLADISQGKPLAALAPTQAISAAAPLRNPAIPADKGKTTDQRALESGQSVTVRPGDTLAGIAARHLRTAGADASPASAWRGALALARSNGIGNPDRIYPGQVVALEALDSLVGTSRSAQSPVKAAIVPARETTALQRSKGADAATANPVLDKTLDRAVALNYLPGDAKEAVRAKILQLATDHRFRPDDLALVSLIESDGFNPRASNGRCFGVIQFCDGADRGAATVGFRDSPKAITGLPVLEQLDLVSRYFSETGLRDFGRAGTATLDDLYLTVLTPAARNDRRLDSPLPIQGNQANILKVDGNPQGAITRRSLIQGLWQTASEKLSTFSATAPGPANAPGPSDGKR